MATPYGVQPVGYKLPDATHVGCVRLQVSDIDRSLAYYQDVIGLRAVHRDGSRASLGPHDSEDVLVELHERRGARPVPQAGHLGLYHFALLVPDRAALGQVLAHLVELDERVASADHLVSEALYLWDPDGLGIEVYADRPRSAWRTHGRELRMATEPLDVRSVILASQGEAWRGLPRGTSVGHVHLSVGSLERAEALYHAALGLDKTVWSFPGALFLAAGGYHHHLGTNTWARGAQPAADDEARLLEWELVVPREEDVRAAAESVSRSGYDVNVDGVDRTVRDDWGISLRLKAEF